MLDRQVWTSQDAESEEQVGELEDFEGGKVRETVSMERLTGLMFLPMQERSAANDAFLPARTHGLALSGTGGDWFTWAVTGEMRAYRTRSGLFNPLPVSRPVNRGGWGTIELAARYSRLDLTDGTVEGGELDILSLGVNWWLTPRYRETSKW
jgi:phosphate-selective porin